MNMAGYLVIAYDDDLDRLRTDRRRSGANYSYTVEGPTLFPLGQVIPIIRSRYGCLGLVKIIELHIRETSTTVDFTVVEKGDPKNYSQIYGAYCSMGGSNPQGSDDEFIPGLHRSKDDPPKGASRSAMRRRRDDYDDDGEDEPAFSKDDLRRIMGLK